MTARILPFTTPPAAADEPYDMFGPLNDLSIIALLWNSGDENRKTALAMAERDAKGARADRRIETKEA